jgi:hypothetical protein
MKRSNYLLPFLLLSGLIAAAPVLADGGLSVTVVNNTQYTLNALYASPSDASSWNTQNNLLTTGQVVNPGAQTTVTFPSPGGDGCQVDLMGILYGAAQYTYQYQVNACGGGGTWAINQ